MLKLLGLGVLFTGKDKGFRKETRKNINEVKGLKDAGEEASNVKPSKKSFWNAIGEISKLGLLSSIADKIDNMGNGLQDINRSFVGGGLTEEFKTVDNLASRISLRMGGDLPKATKLVNDRVDDLVKSLGLTTENSVEIVGAFESVGLHVDKFGSGLKSAGKLVKFFNADAVQVAQSFAVANKRLNFSQKTLEDLTNQAVLLETKTNLSGLAAGLPEAIQFVQKQVEQGIIPRAKAKQSIQDILNLKTTLRGAGFSAEEAQSSVEGLFGNMKDVLRGFGEIAAGKTGNLSELGSVFNKLGLDIGRVKQAFKEGDINAVIGEILSGAKNINKLGRKDIQAFNILLEDAFGDVALPLIDAMKSGNFKDFDKQIKNVNQTLLKGKGGEEAAKAFKVLGNTVEEQEERLKGLQELFDKNVGNAIKDTTKRYNEFKIKTLESLSNVEKGSDNFFTSALIGFKKYQQGGILPFVDSWGSAVGISEDSIFKITAAFDTIGPIINDAKEEIFFFTGTLAHAFPLLKKVSFATKTTTGEVTLLGKAVKFALGPWGLAIAAITALTAGFVFLYNNSETFRKATDAGVETLKEFGGWVWDLAKKYLPPLWENIKSVGSFVFEWLTPFGLIIKIFKQLGKIFPETTKAILDFFNPVSKVFDKVSGFVKNVWKDISGKQTKEIELKTKTSGEVTSPDTVSQDVRAPKVKSPLATQPGGGGGFSENPNATKKQLSAEQAKIEDPNMKALANLFVQVGAEIVTAIESGQQMVQVQLKGDAAKFFRASSKVGNRNLENLGTAG